MRWLKVIFIRFILKIFKISKINNSCSQHTLTVKFLFYKKILKSFMFSKNCQKCKIDNSCSQHTFTVKFLFDKKIPKSFMLFKNFQN